MPTVSIDESYYKDTDVGDEIRRIQAAELEILAEIQRICKRIILNIMRMETL